MRYMIVIHDEDPGVILMVIGPFETRDEAKIYHSTNQMWGGEVLPLTEIDERRAGA